MSDSVAMSNAEWLDVLNFWFGDSDDDAEVAKQNRKRWWTKTDDTDREIRHRYQSLVEAAVSGSLDHWIDDPRGRLALILVTDQFPRNIFRNTPRCYAYDDIALVICLDTLEKQIDISLRPIERVFLYLPLEHSESLENQERCVSLMETLAGDVPGKWRRAFEDFVKYSVAHRDIIRRFGRFPHRNVILGRQSTREELEFLEQPGSSF